MFWDLFYIIACINNLFLLLLSSILIYKIFEMCLFNECYELLKLLLMGLFVKKILTFI